MLWCCWVRCSYSFGDGIELEPRGIPLLLVGGRSATLPETGDNPPTKVDGSSLRSISRTESVSYANNPLTAYSGREDGERHLYFGLPAETPPLRSALTLERQASSWQQWVMRSSWPRSEATRHGWVISVLKGTASAACIVEQVVSR